MKKLFTLFAIVTTITIFAQAPQGFNYQATVRNSSGQLLLNQDVLVKFNILQNSATGDIVYSETQTATTDDLGQINLVVGQGTATTGVFSSINWGTGNYYLGIELDSGTGYAAMGTTQLMSVPYALNGMTSIQTDIINAQVAINKDIQSQLTNMQAQINYLLKPTVIIGTQNWTTKNLDVETYSDGTPIPEVQNAEEWASLTTGAWCYYNNDSANGATYGKLYNWYAVAGIHDTDPNTPNKKLAPTGYHIPSDDEWTTLTTYLDAQLPAGNAGGKMKATSTSIWNAPNTDATNSSGFTGLPGGYRYTNGTFYNVGIDVSLWSSQETNTQNAWYLALYYNSGYANRLTYFKVHGFSVRCLRD